MSFFKVNDRLWRRAARSRIITNEYVERVWGMQRAFLLRDHLKAVMREERPCYPKQQHDTRGGADAQKRSIEKRNLQKNSRLHVYHCPHCFKYHVGHASHGRKGGSDGNV